MMIEDLSVDDDDDYQIFIQRKDTIKKNLTAMAAVTYDEKPNQRQEVLQNIDRALMNEEEIYKLNRISIKNINMRKSVKFS